MPISIPPAFRAFLLASLTAAAWTVPTHTAAQGYEVTTIRYVHGGIGVDPLELADKLGYLAPLKLERAGDSSGLGGGPANIQAVATNQIDIGGAFNGTIAKVVSVGVPVKAVIGYYGQDKGVTGTIATLEGSGITSARDLIGKKVGLNTLGANSEALVDHYLKENGLTEAEIKSVTLVPLPGSTIEQALRQKQVAAVRLSSFATKVAQSRGGIKVLTSDVELIGPHNGGSYVLRNKFIKDNPKTTAKLVDAIARAIQYAQQHPVAEVRTLYAQYFKDTGRADQVKALDNWEGLGVSSPGGTIQDVDFSIWLDWLARAKEVGPEWKNRVRDLYTNDFNPYKK